jgi:hypothetical protein
MRASHRRIVLPLAMIWLVGCQYTGSPTGQGTVTSPLLDPFAIPPPPPGVPGLPPPGVGSAPTPRPANGQYAGVAKALNNPGAVCDDTVRIAGWSVQDSQVSWRGFQGTVARDGGLRMQYGDAYIVGTYTGSHFGGRFWRPQPNCTYVLSVDPI